MFFGSLSLLWTAGLLSAVYVVPQKTGFLTFLDIHQFNQQIYLVLIWALGEVYMFHLFRRRKSEKIIQQAVQDHPFVPVKGFVPHAMPSQGKSMLYIPTPAAPAATFQAPPAAAQPVAQNPVSELEKQAVETISKIAEEKGLTPFPHCLLENIMIPLTVSADIKAVLLTFLSASGTWKVEMKEPVAETLWTNQTGSSPVLKKLLDAKRILSGMEPDAEVVPALVLLDGDVEQEQQVQEFLNKNGIHLVRLNSKENSVLLTISQLLDKEFKDILEQEKAEVAEEAQGAPNV